MWAKADPSAGVMSEGIGAADEECSGKARMQGARLRTLLERQTSDLKINNISLSVQPKKSSFDID